MIWLLLAAIVFVYFSLGFAYFPIFDQCVGRTRGQWLMMLLFYFFWPPTLLVLVVGGITEMTMANINRSPEPVECRWLQKIVFWTAFGLPLLWINVACWFGSAALKIFGVPDRYESRASPEQHDM